MSDTDQPNGWDLFAVFLSMIVIIGFKAVTVWLLWMWFLVPLGAPEINIAHAYGILLFVYSATRETRKSSPPYSLGTWQAEIKSALLSIAIVLLAGFLAKVLS